MFIVSGCPKKSLPGALLVGVLAAILAGCSPGQVIHSRGELVAAPVGSISVYQLAGRLGLTVCDSASTSATLRDRRNSVNIYPAPNGHVFVNGRRLAGRFDTVAVSGILFVPQALAGQIRPQLQAVPAPVPVVEPTPVVEPLGCVVFDPGHGGRDPGAISAIGLQEKDVNLAVTRMIEGRLARNGVEGHLTRTDDSYVALDARARIANSYEPQLFVSIHADSARDTQAEGFTVYVARSASARSRRAAAAIERAMSAAGVHSRGVREANYRVLVRTACPAVLVELGFLSNPYEGIRLADEDYRQRLAEAVSEGIIDFLTSE